MKAVFHTFFRIGHAGHLPDDPGPILRLGFTIIFLFVGGALSWMALVPLDGAIVSEGVVKVTNERIPIQHAKGGVVSALHVKDGATVKAGQPLFEISEPSRLAGFQSTRYQQISELARNARLRSEQLLSERVVFPSTVLARADDPEVAQVIGQEEAVFRNRRDALLDAEQAMRREMALIRLERKQLAARATMQKEAVSLTNEQLVANEDLMSKGFVSRQRILELKRAHVAEQASAGQLEADRLRAEQRLAELERSIAQQRNHFLETVAQELKSSDDRLHQLEQLMSAQQSDVARDTVVAPIGGVVMNMRSLSVGTTVGPLQTVMEIVPSDDALYIETPVVPRNIRYVQVGGPAEVQVSGWNRRTMPMLTAKVDYISADVVRVKDDMTAYVVRLKVEKPASNGPVEPLRPGMQAMVYLRTPSHTVLDYLLEPVIDSMRAAFREPI
ncbi:MAG: HlyD family type I secretion periplasmic adaptor subunit [Betaproteobacteria bacterium]|nr:HlyD family type I secretion periplasmic adaptor subunit [Betaproteobacteria bacterium]